MHNHSSNDKSTESEEESRKILERVRQESETVGTSSLGRVAERVKSHMSAHDADQNEWAELWGTRIGRSLGVIFAVGLFIYLVQTYILNG